MPISIRQNVYDAARTQATAGVPNETCGVIYNNITAGTQSITFINNISEEPEKYFLFDPLLLSAEVNRITNAPNLMLLGYFHSHVDATELPSTQDQMMINKLNIDMLIYSVYTDNFLVVEPNSEQFPLVGRQFNHVTANCYTLVRDYYIEIRGITLTNYVQIPNWWQKGLNLFIDYAQAEGFVEVNALQKHDIILMQINAPVPNHVGVYLGNNIMLHHPLDRLSQRTIYGGYWMKHTWGYYRR